MSPRVSDSPAIPSETFLFADLCGFAEYTCRHGDAHAADLAVAFHRRVREVASEEGCDVVKCIGDAVMVHSADCRVGLRLALRIVAMGDQDGCPPIRVGLDWGPAVRRDGDWYGTTVNAAARLAAAATPGEVLVTDRARNALSETASIELRARGVREVKGMPASPLYAAVAA